MLFLIMYIHLIGCVWFIIVKSDESWVPPTDYIYGKTSLYDDNIWKKYWFCFYHSIFMMIGGEIGVRNAVQALYSSGLMIVGVLITAVLFGEMAVLMSNLNRKSSRF